MKKKILIVLPELRQIGGIQASLINLLQNLETQKYCVSLCILDNRIPKTTSIPKNVNIIKGFNLLKFLFIPYQERHNFSLFEKSVMIVFKVLKKVFGIKPIFYVYSVIKKFRGNYDYAISYTNEVYVKDKMLAGGSNIIVDKCVNAKKKIAWIHSEPHKEGLNFSICKKTYKNYDVVVTVSKACQDIFNNIIPQYENKSHTVYNTFNIKSILEKAESSKQIYDNEFFNIVTVARVNNHQKNIIRVVQTSEYLVSKGIRKFKWHVVGDGEDFEKMEQEVKKRGLEKYVYFVGQKSNPFPYIKQADLFVLTSKSESYGMALKESMIIGTPVITTNFPAAKEIVDDGLTGVISGFTVESIGNNIIRILENPVLLKKINQNLKINKINNEESMAQFDEILSL